jgi:hypothetical protein
MGPACRPHGLRRPWRPREPGDLSLPSFGPYSRRLFTERSDQACRHWPRVRTQARVVIASMTAGAVIASSELISTVRKLAYLWHVGLCLYNAPSLRT